MLASAQLVAFIPTRDPQRAKAFYGETLGLRLVREDPFALVFDAAGTPLRVTPVEKLMPHPFTVSGWLVPDIASVVTGLTQRGVTFLRFAGMTQDAQGVWTAPGGSRVAWFQDPDGNTLSLTEHSK